MWRRHSIAQRKASGDAKKSQTYAKIGRIIQMAAKNGADAGMNPALDLALQKARYYGLPRDVIDKAILKGSGQLESEVLHEVMYEVYGPAGSAILIKAVTDNINRTAMTVKTTIGKLGCSLGKPGSVEWKFEELWVFVIDGKSEKVMDKGKEIEQRIVISAEEMELELMDMPAKNIEHEEDKIIVTCEKIDFSEIQKLLKQHKFNVIEWALKFIPKDTTKIVGEATERLQKLLEQLEDDDDVTDIFLDVDLD